MRAAGGMRLTPPAPSVDQRPPPSAQRRTSRSRRAAADWGALATASLALGMMSPPAHGAAAQPFAAHSALAQGVERHRGEPIKLGQSRSQPMLALRSLPTTEVTKHPGVKNALKVRRLPRSRPEARLRPAAKAPPAARI